MKGRTRNIIVAAVVCTILFLLMILFLFMYEISKEMARAKGEAPTIAYLILAIWMPVGAVVIIGIVVILNKRIAVDKRRQRMERIRELEVRCAEGRISFLSLNQLGEEEMIGEEEEHVE